LFIIDGRGAQRTRRARKTPAAGERAPYHVWESVRGTKHHSVDIKNKNRGIERGRTGEGNRGKTGIFNRVLSEKHSEVGIETKSEKIKGW